MTKEEIQILRDELYDELPTGEVHAFDLIELIKRHIAKMDDLIEKLQSQQQAATPLPAVGEDWKVEAAAKHYAQVQYGDPAKYTLPDESVFYSACVMDFKAGAEWMQAQLRQQATPPDVAGFKNDIQNAIAKHKYPFAYGRTKGDKEKGIEPENMHVWMIDAAKAAKEVFELLTQQQAPAPEDWKQRAEHFEKEFDAVNKEVLYLQAQRQQQPSLRWVKASELLPEKEGYNFHVKASSRFAGYAWNDTAIYRGAGKWDFAYNKGQYVTEWLEEDARQTKGEGHK